MCLRVARCGLTPRTSGAPTAGHQARSGGTPYIFTGPGLASCRRRPLSSNVRPHNQRPRHATRQNSRIANPTTHRLPGLSLTDLSARSCLIDDFSVSYCLSNPLGFGSIRSCQLCNHAVENTLGFRNAHHANSPQKKQPIQRACCSNPAHG